MSDRTFNEALKENIEGVAGSDAFVCLYSTDMAAFKKEPWPAIQLAIAILLDKPIIIAVLPGRSIPERLRRIADEVIEGDPEELAHGIAAFMEAHK